MTQSVLLADPQQATVPGVYDIPADLYHADPVPGGSISSSGAKALLACPARYHYDRTHPRAPKREFDLGHAAHRRALGVGQDVVIVESDSWRTTAAQNARDDAYAAGKTPVLPADWDAVTAMHAALLAHDAAEFFTGGVAEQALVWRDDAVGVWFRAMLDYRRGPVIVDYKTTTSADPHDLAGAVARYGYDIQTWWYRDGVRAVGLADDPEFVFVAQEKEPPYLVTVFQLDADYLAIGEAKARRAREMFRDCTASRVWPSYPGTEAIVTLAPPRWVRHQYEEYL